MINAINMELIRKKLQYIGFNKSCSTNIENIKYDKSGPG